MKRVLLKDHKKYAELQAKHDALMAELKPMVMGESPDVMRAKAQAAAENVELEAAALLDPARYEGKAKRVRQEVKELMEAAQYKERRIRVLQLAIDKLRPDLDEARGKAAEEVIKAIRPEHEAVALKIVELQRQLNAALEGEQEICQFLRREVGSDAAIVPVYRMMGYANKWGKVQPGREDDQNSTFYRIITRLRERGYKV